jgi:hypothetical protein
MSRTFINWFSLEEEVILIPEFLKTDIYGFKFLTNFHNLTKKKKHFKIDFTKCQWIEANLCAILGASIHVNTLVGAKFTIVNLELKPYIKSTFLNNGFLEFIRNEKTRKNEHSGVPFAKYDMKNEKEFEDYIYKYILSTQNIPKMSEGAKKKIFRSIFELYQNSVMHSGADQIYVCGQYYFRKGRLALTMVEFGNTFKSNVQGYKLNFSLYTGAECIEWAVESGNTTKKINNAGGLGLDLIRDFLNMNQGKLQINSADGYWEEKKGVKFVRECDFNFPGSIVNIEFNLRDLNNYIAKEEFNISDIL